MRRDFSLYMDVIRFFAAMVVFLSHSSSQSLTGGLFWQFKDYAQTAVIVFFVLSGYVIAFIVELALIVKASLTARDGEIYKYPLTINFLK